MLFTYLVRVTRYFYGDILGWRGSQRNFVAKCEIMNATYALEIIGLWELSKCIYRRINKKT